jgi:hypothetical protein
MIVDNLEPVTHFVLSLSGLELFLSSIVTKLEHKLESQMFYIMQELKLFLAYNEELL